MNTALQLAKSIQIDGKGIHVLLWDNQDDLARALLVLFAALHETSSYSLLLVSAQESAVELRSLFDLQPLDEESDLSDEDSLKTPRDSLLVLFLQQATSRTIGPWLNGWRSDLADSPGTLLIVRHADFPDFQRSAPDLASYFLSKISDSSSMLPIWDSQTAKKIKNRLPREIRDILKELPGERPSNKEIEIWKKQHPPVDED